MEIKKFQLRIECRACGSMNFRLIKDMDFGMDDNLRETGDIIIKCLDCKIDEKVHLEYEKLT